MNNVGQSRQPAAVITTYQSHRTRIEMAKTVRLFSPLLGKNSLEKHFPTRPAK